MTPVVLAVDDLRDQYLREMALVRQTCERTGDGTAAIRRRSAVVDRILIEMWRRAFGTQSAPNMALLAMGGYGRKDLFPYSDIDVLFAFPGAIPSVVGITLAPDQAFVAWLLGAAEFAVAALRIGTSGWPSEPS